MAETLREFLVSVGYKVDGNSERRFEDSMKRATLRAELLGRAIAETAEAMVRSATRIAGAFDDIYYASQRTQSSVQNMKALSYAVSQLGGSYGGAMGAIENFARNLRSNPGYASMVRMLGVSTEQNGRLKDTTQIIRELSRELARSNKPYYIQKQYFEALGLDENTYNALKSGELVRYLDEYNKKQQQLGVDQARAAEIGRDLTRSWRSLNVTLAALGEKLMQSVGPALTRFVQKLDEFITNNADKIEAFFAGLLKSIEALADAFIKLVEKGEGPIVDMFEKIGKSVDVLMIALGAFATFLVAKWLVQILGAFAAVGSGFGAMLLRLGINPATLGIAVAMAPSTANAGEDAEIARRRAAGTWGPAKPGDMEADAAKRQADRAKSPSLWERTKRFFGMGAQAATIDPEQQRARSIRRSRGGGAGNSWLTKEQSAELAAGIKKSGEDLGVAPDDLATAISYETAGTMHPWKRGPTTKWGTHRGLIQWGEPQAAKYGVTKETSITDQMSAVTRYLRDRGVRPGHSLGHIYSAINAGNASPAYWNRTDAHAGGAPGTVADKVRGMSRTHAGALGRLESAGGVAPPVAGPAASPDARGAMPKLTPGSETPGPQYGNAGSSPKEVEQAKMDKHLETLRNSIREENVQKDLAVLQTTLNEEQLEKATAGLAAPGPLQAPGGGGDTSISQKNEITINGASDPTATASAVEGARKPLDASLIRNVQGAVR